MGDVVKFAARTAARIGEVSGCRVGDIDTENWVWTIRRQTTPSPGEIADKGTKTIGHEWSRSSPKSGTS